MCCTGEWKPPSLAPDLAAARLVERGDVPELRRRAEPEPYPMPVPDGGWPCRDWRSFDWGGVRP